MTFKMETTHNTTFLVSLFPTPFTRSRGLRSRGVRAAEVVAGDRVFDSRRGGRGLEGGGPEHRHRPPHSLSSGSTQSDAGKDTVVIVINIKLV